MLSEYALFRSGKYFGYHKRTAIIAGGRLGAGWQAHALSMTTLCVGSVIKLLMFRFHFSQRAHSSWHRQLHPCEMESFSRLMAI